MSKITKHTEEKRSFPLRVSSVNAIKLKVYEDSLNTLQESEKEMTSKTSRFGRSALQTRWKFENQ